MGLVSLGSGSAGLGDAEKNEASRGGGHGSQSSDRLYQAEVYNSWFNSHTQF